MPVIARSRPRLSDLVKGVSRFADDTATRFNFDTVLVQGTGSVDNIGIPLIFNATDDKFEVYVDQDIDAAITAGGSPLKDGSVLGVSVGDKTGFGANQVDTDLSSDAYMTIMYRGDASIVDNGMVWGSADSTAQEAFLAQLELQRITTIDNAEVVTPTYN